jgi:hypothetical protein
MAEEKVRRELIGLTPDSPTERDLAWLDSSRARALTPGGRWLLLDDSPLRSSIRPSDETGIEGISSVLMTPDGKYYVYGVSRVLNDLFIVSSLQ